MTLSLSLIFVAAAIILIIVLTSWLRIHAFLALFLVALLLAISVLPAAEVVPVLKKGFGDTMASIGLIIVLGAIIGVTLDMTGATVSMANFIIRKTGPSRAPEAISIAGFISGLPIFCDSGFIVLSGLNRSLTSKSGQKPVFMATVLATALYSVHCLIPPHPGATAAAGIVGANIGKLVVIGILVALPAALAGFIWARFTSRHLKSIDKPVNEPDIPLIPLTLPSAGKSFMPVIIPLLLITCKSFVMMPGKAAGGHLSSVIGFLGDPVIALLAGVFLSFFLFPKFSLSSVNNVLATAVEKAGPIIIITAAGGIFGGVIKATGVGEQAGNLLAGTGLGLLVPFLIAFVMKTAQGSSTVAIITTASIIAPMTGHLGFSGENGKLLVMLAMGAGSMMVSHANDSYFWVITNFSGIRSDDTLKHYSTATIVMALTSLATVYLLSLFLR